MDPTGAVALQPESDALVGVVTLPANATGIVLIADDVGVATHLHQTGLATFTLGSRESVVQAADWVQLFEPLKHLEIGCFGFAAGASAVLRAAAERPESIGVLVCCGRVDVPVPVLNQVRAKVLYISVGEPAAGADLIDHLPYGVHVTATTGAAEIALLTRAWFARHLGASRDTLQ